MIYVKLYISIRYEQYAIKPDLSIMKINTFILSTFWNKKMTW